MQVELKRAWKNHPPGTVLDVSDGVHDDLIRLGVLEGGRAPEKAPAAGRVKAFRGPARDKMIKSSVEDK